MFRFASALLLAAVSIAPAQAATIIVNPGNTALPGYTEAGIIQNFNTPATGANQFVPNSTIQAGVGTESVTNATRVTTRDIPLSGFSEDYLGIANNASYTLAFLQPQSFFSFAFNIIGNPGNNAYITFNYVGGGTETRNGLAIFGLPNGSNVKFGRVSYDREGDAQITSVIFGKNPGGNTNRLMVDTFAAAVPEPATWLMMILGFGLVGSQLRRRKGKAVLAAA